MKVRRDADTIEFELDRVERQYLLFLLRRYPVLDPAYHRIASPADAAAFSNEQEWLTEQMTADQASHRRQVEEFIEKRMPLPDPTPDASPGSTDAESNAESDSSPREPAEETVLKISLALAEADWLLRIINDVRVGSWVRLGRPENEIHQPPSDARLVPDYLALEVASMVQYTLLYALNQPGQPFDGSSEDDDAPNLE